MLEGLEISEVLLSELEYSGRIDSEYYKPYFLDCENIILNKSGVELKELSDFLIGPFGSSFTVDNYTDDTSFRYIRGKDVKSMKLMDDDNAYMPKKDYERLIKYALRENDILVSVVGTLGNAALITKKDLPAIFSCKSTVLRPFNINPAYLLVYINSKYGKNLLIRKERGAIQKGLNLDDLKTLNIYQASIDFQKRIDYLFNLSLENTELSKQTYTQAENLLLETLGLKDFTPSKEKVNIKSFKDSFLSSGRLDAEYYQPKYEDYISLIKKYKNGYKELSDICYLKDKNYKPDDKTTYKYIELSNIGKSGEISDCTNAFGGELPSRAKRKVNKNDVIVSSIEGSLDSCAIITEDYHDSICSTGFYVINSEELNSETLLVLFKSGTMQNILKQNCSGTILTAINKNEFLQIPLPVIEENIQQQISKKIEESFKLKKQSEQLLELAKTAVEIAVEEDEEMAVRFIEENKTMKI